MELQQSELYAQYIKKLGWIVEYVDGCAIFIKQFPFFGSFAKLQRLYPLPSVQKIQALFKKYHVKNAVIEASPLQDEKAFKIWCSDIRQMVRIVQSPYLPTKTLLIDITPPEHEIFNLFAEAKRRAVRRAQKNNIQVIESNDIRQLIAIKNKSAGFLGFITTHGTKDMWNIFAPNYATTILGFAPKKQSREHATIHAFPEDYSLEGGILLIFWNDIAYYWIAGATVKGKKLFIPTLLVWEAIKIAKNRGCKQFDFVGVWDERFPKENTQWHGFTKFKEGFGGSTLYYPTHRTDEITRAADMH